MKYSIKKYAQALVGSLDNKADVKKISSNFLKLLQKNQDMKRANQILILAEGLLLKKNGKKKVTFEIARKTDTKDIVKTFVKKGDVVEQKLNPSLIAGIKIKVNNDRQLDLSLAKKLENIF